MSSDIFNFQYIKSKAYREIERLVKYETLMDKLNAVDSAINAAISVYHIMDWQHQESYSHIKTKPHEICKNSNNNSLKILHYMANYSKHAKVSCQLYWGDALPKINNNVECIVLESGEQICTENGAPMVTESSYLHVYFGEFRALELLNFSIEYILSGEIYCPISGIS